MTNLIKMQKLEQEIIRLLKAGYTVEEAYKKLSKSDLLMYEQFLTQKLRNVRKQRDSLIQGRFALESCIEWLSMTTFTIDKNDNTRIHKLLEGYNEDLVLAIRPNQEKLDADIKATYGATTFVVRHDWYCVLKETCDSTKNDEIKLPYDCCAFEFIINGKPIIVLATQDVGQGPLYSVFVNNVDSWIYDDANNNNPAAVNYALQQVKAICIVLDSEIAKTTVVSAPAALNAKRIKNSKLPIRSYNVVDLSKSRKKYDVTFTGTHASPRFHFRRGHWRHYDDHKTWIKWNLIGNPDTGFVDKYYKL